MAHLSQPLYNLTKGNTIEARAGRARWKDVSKATFERFVQFAYTGDYSIPKTEQRSSVEKGEHGETTASYNSVSSNAPNGVRERLGSPESEHTLVTETNDITLAVDHVEPPIEKIEDDSGSILNYPSMTSKKNRKKKRRQTITEDARPEVVPEPAPIADDAKTQKIIQDEVEDTTKPEADPDPEPKPGSASLEQQISQQEPSPILVMDFKAISYPLLGPRDNYDGTCEPLTEFKKEHNYSDVFLSHASLYVLGDVQLVSTLKALALFKLHKTLCHFELDNENIGDITELARYAYSGGDKSLEKGIGGLKELVCQYMAIHAVELSGDARFMNLLAGGGQLVKDFFRFQLQRVQ